jgi:hypothetical protein
MGIKAAKVVWVCIGTKINKDGEEVNDFRKVGHRLDMEDGSWWFHCRRTKLVVVDGEEVKITAHSWTKHWQGLVAGPPLMPPVPVARKETFSLREIVRAYGPKLLATLEAGAVQAEAEEAAKREERRAT